MKKLITLFVFCAFYSCSIETDTHPDLVAEGTWKLVRTNGQFPGSERTGDQMEFQETYQLNEDMTFLKKRVQEGVTNQAEGTYILEEQGYSLRGEAVIIFIKMIFNEQTPIIASCTSAQLQEDLYFTWDHRMVSTYEACDGPGLEYIKMRK